VIKLLEHLVFANESLLLLLHVHFQLRQLILADLLLQLDLAALLEDLVVLVFHLLQALLVPLLQLQLLVFILAELSADLNEVLFQFFNGFLEHGDLLPLYGLILGQLFAEPNVFLLEGRGLPALLADLLLHGAQRTHELFDFSLAG
jgi:hypothetical protein